MSDDANAQTALCQTGAFATPLRVVGDKKGRGFRPDEIAAALLRLGPAADAV